MPDVRWTMTDRGFRHYAETEGHEVYESSAASAPHLWVDGEHLTVEDAATLRDALSDGHWRDTLTAAIDGHYQTRAVPQGWEAGDPCSLCGSTATGIENDCAYCKGCGAFEGDDAPHALDDEQGPKTSARSAGPDEEETA